MCRIPDTPLFVHQDTRSFLDVAMHQVLCLLIKSSICAFGTERIHILATSMTLATYRTLPAAVPLEKEDQCCHHPSSFDCLGTNKCLCDRFLSPVSGEPGCLKSIVTGRMKRAYKNLQVMDGVDAADSDLVQKHCQGVPIVVVFGSPHINTLGDKKHMHQLVPLTVTWIQETRPFCEGKRFMVNP